MTRRELLAAAAALPWGLRIPLDVERHAPPLKFAVITDLHHGLAPDALSRLRAFVDEVKQRKDLDFVMQMGDFCYSTPESKECVDLFKTLPHKKVHVLGNHDMDKVDKTAAMSFWGMTSRYGAHHFGGWRFIVLDLNHFKKEGKLHSYDKGNYFTDNATHNWADPEQLDWLAKELRSDTSPTVLVSHQPLGFAEPGQAIPPEQRQVLDVVEKARRDNPKGAVALSLFGHLHVDRLEQAAGMPCLCVNSASYFWYEGMRPYTKPLFAFMEITADGHLHVQGVEGAFATPPPPASDNVLGRSASIRNRTISGLRP